jgi:predicted nucleic-acid-binding protein
VRIAPDTNILVRLLTRDDAAQCAVAEAALSEATQIVVTPAVLLELAWVLARAYRLGRTEIAAALRALEQRSGWTFPTGMLEPGVQALEAGGDFADGVIAAQAAQMKCDELLTFDRRFARAGVRIATRVLPSVPPEGVAIPDTQS